MGKISSDRGKELEDAVNQIVRDHGYTPGRKTLKGRRCSWRPDFLIPVGLSGRILVVECKNPKASDDTNIGIAARELVTMFLDLRNNPQSKSLEFCAVLGKGVDIEKGHLGFRSLLEKDLGVTVVDLEGFAKVLKTLKG
jgi:hypothetical protein